MMTNTQQMLIDSIIDYRRHIMNTKIDIYRRDHECGGLSFYVNHKVIDEATMDKHIGRAKGNK